MIYRAHTSRRNREGLTWDEWRKAACLGLPARIWSIVQSELYSDWLAGVDPAEWPPQFEAARLRAAAAQ